MKHTHTHITRRDVPVLQASDRRSEGAVLSPTDLYPAWSPTSATCTCTVKHTDPWIKDTSSDTRTHVHTLVQLLHSATKPIVSDIAGCYTSILSGEDGDKFLSCQPVIMALPLYSWSI